MKFVVVVSLFVLAAALACDGESTTLSTERDRQDATYLTQVAAWFERYERGFSDGTKVIDRAMLKEIRDIDPPPSRQHDHGILVNAYALYVEAEERVQALEPSEQAEWTSQGADVKAACIDLWQDLLLKSYASEEFEFACTVSRLAQNLWSRVSAEWLVSILDAYVHDPYGVRD
jgi:hypothetical protein